MRREVRVELGIQVDSLSDVGDQREEGKLLKRDKVEEAQDLTEEMTHAIDADIAWDLETIISFFAARPQGDDEYLWSMLAQQVSSSLLFIIYRPQLTISIGSASMNAVLNLRGRHSTIHVKTRLKPCWRALYCQPIDLNQVHRTT